MGVLVVHGMGDHPQSFADDLINRIKARLGAQKDEAAFIPCWWNPVLQPHQNTIWEKMKATPHVGMDYNKLRKWIVSFLGDPVLYLSGYFKASRSVYGAVHKEVCGSLAKLRSELDSDAAPLMVLAHSLGSVVISNYLWDEQHGHGLGTTPFEQAETLTSFITYGSNIPLFIPPPAAGKPITCIKFPSANLPDNLKAVARWINIFDTDDVLGYPLSNVWDDTQDTVIKDVNINAGTWPLSETPLSHSLYEKDGSFLQIVDKQIKGILAAVP